MARKTESSTGTVGVKCVGVEDAVMPTACAELEMAGPAGLPAGSELLSPGMSERRVVLGVHAVVTPKQVSCTRIWRTPLLGVPVAFSGYFEGVTERKAMKRPDELTEGRRLSLPAMEPVSSVETSVVCGVHCVVAPAQVSRR